MRYFLSLILIIAITSQAFAQTCSTLGQRPSSAFPVCAVDTFKQTTVPYCSNGKIPVAGCAGDGVTYEDKNPYWYKFDCYQSGSLAFTILPNSANEDYDWQIFDITGHNPDDVYTDASLFVVGNWSGSYAPTGTSGLGVSNIECASNPNAGVSTFSAMPSLVKGHTYLLMVSHYSDSPNGYGLSFNTPGSGGTAVITDTTPPAIQSATASCDGSQITVRLNKKMKCASLAVDGSDFSIPGTTSKIISAAGIGCSSGFDMDTVILTMDVPLPAGNYQVIAQFGNDGTSVTDNCDRDIPSGNSVNFSVFVKQPTPFDSITPPGCAPDQVQLFFKKNIRCSSIAPNGSDFSITGPYPASVIAASGVCNAGLTNVINIKMSQPLYTAGSFLITLLNGIDGNSIIDECGEETIAGAALGFVVKDTVSADFTSNLVEGCSADTLNLFHNGNNGVTSWNWLFDNTLTSTAQNPIAYYATFGNKTVQLIVTNGFCTDTTVADFYLNHDSLQAAISGPSFYCPNELATFKDSSNGKIISWYWSFGNGNVSYAQNPPSQSYKLVNRETIYPVQLIVQSDKNCFNTAVKFIKAVANCYIAIPSAFTPNHDGKNDYLYPLNAYKATNLTFRVYNKFGQVVYDTKDWTRKWDGTLNGQAQPSDVYVWTLEYTDEFGQKVFQKGTTVLIR